MRWLIFLLLAFACGGYAKAQCKTVTGLVKDGATGEALLGATVRAANDAGTGVITDVNGKFQWKTDTTVLVRISFVGFEDVEILIGKECEVEVNLLPSSTGLDEVVIKSERLIAEEFTVSKIKKLEIYTNPSARADPLLAVNASPSATTTDESANISLRGGSPNETGIFLNNVPINDAVRYAQLNGIGTFSIFNTALINQVQVYPGNPPLEFGNTTSGLIALTTDEDIPDKAVNTVSVSLASMGYFTSRKVGRKSALTAFANYQPSALLRWFNPAALERVKRFRTADMGLHYFSRLSDRTVFKVFNYSNRESFLFDSRTPTYRGDFNQEKIRNYTVANLRHRFRNSELSLNQGISYSHARFSLSTLNARLNLTDFFTSLNYQYFGKKGEVKTGLSYDYRGSDFRGQFPRYNFALGEQYPVDSATSRAAVRLPEAYAYGKINLSSKWIAGGGIRRGISLGEQPAFWSSQVNLNFRPSKPWNFILSAGRYNKLLIPQGSTSGVDHIQTDQYSLDVTHTTQRLEGSFSLFAKNGQQGQLKTAVQGLELFGRYRINRNLRTQLSITSLSAKQTMGNETTSSPFDIRYFLRGNVEYKFLGTWTTTLVFLFREGSFWRPVSGATFNPNLGVFEPTFGALSRLPNYSLLDFSVSKLFAVGKEASAVAFCGLSNIPNFQNVRDYAYNFDYTEKTAELFSLRTIYFGVVINF
ncbi:MAG: carboxypeptidase-like regulatory domain-containing protein [Cyclobacteriaceae bacterium]